MMKIKRVVLLLSLLLVLSFTVSLVSCFQNEVTSTTSKEQNPDEGDIISGSENIINVYLIAGQSNAVGYGMDTTRSLANSDPRFTNGFENVLYYGVQERWNGKNLDNGFEPVKLGMGVASDRSGAEIGIASALAENGEMNAIIKCAWGATHLYPDTTYDISLTQGTWTSPTYIKNNNVDTSVNPLIGNMYTRFEDTVIKGLQLLIEEGYTPVIKGIWWMQGEAEMFTYQMASAYRELLETLIFDMRNTLSAASGYDCGNVPFVCGLPKWNTKNSAPPTYQGMVRTAMQTVAVNLENVGCVDCMPLNQHDDWHFDAEGQLYLGESFIGMVEEFNEENPSAFEENVSIDKDIELLIDETGLGFKANLTNYSNKNEYEYGFIFVPTRHLDDNGLIGNYIEALSELNVEFVDIKADVVFDQVRAKTDIYFTGKLTDLTYNELNTSYTAIAYIKNASEEYLYSSRYTSESFARLASEELYRNEDAKDDLLSIVNAGINSAMGLPQDNEVTFELLGEDKITMGLSQAKSEYQLEISKSADVDYFVRYSSNDPEIASVDQNGVVTAHKSGETFIIVECAGRSKKIAVTVSTVTSNGVALDGIISENEYVGEIFVASNTNLSAEFVGMIREGNLYMAFELIHGDWSPLSSNWWLNDNIEFKLNNGTSYTVVFYEGVATFSNNITGGMTNTEEKDGKLVTTVEIFVENVGDVAQFRLGFNGANFGWLGAVWNDFVNTAFVTEDGIVIASPVNMGNGIILDGVFDEDAYSETVKSNVIIANGNGANVEIMGTLLENGVLFGVTVDHTKAPTVPTGGNGDWFTFLNIEFHFNDGNDQYLITAKNITTYGHVFAYSKSVATDSGYTTTFEMYVPFEAIGEESGAQSINFTARGWFETGWCDLLNTSWTSSHKVTSEGVFKK